MRKLYAAILSAA
ncbi:outer membrane protein lom, partial [Escherichia coli PA32]